MKVKDLIKKLKKMPQDLPVYWADHDHGTFEINSSVGWVGHIEMPDQDEDYDEFKQWEYERKGFEDSTPEEYVCIRP